MKTVVRPNPFTLQITFLVLILFLKCACIFVNLIITSSWILKYKFQIHTLLFGDYSLFTWEFIYFLKVVLMIITSPDIDPAPKKTPSSGDFIKYFFSSMMSIWISNFYPVEIPLILCPWFQYGHLLKVSSQLLYSYIFNHVVSLWFVLEFFAANSLKFIYPLY